ncbi:hypothetical protein [Oligella urethralis]|uniref:Uncharacterized protein n=1 Tax=Oligella urethralis TaxID=90245 RepID=A0A2X1UPR5_9BURK|nr:hypothetical protein [Oligella urethralis]SPY09087.1 Uncharacterised protein [Oligella urethralis]
MMLLSTSFLTGTAHAYYYNGTNASTWIDVPLENQEGKQIGTISQGVLINPSYSTKKAAFNTRINVRDLLGIGSNFHFNMNW